MRVLVVGNTCQNGWLLARFLRDHAGIDADLLYQGNSPVYSPWWEEGGDPAWVCPAWAHPLDSLLRQVRGAAARYDLAVLIGGLVGAGPALQGLLPYVVFDCGLLRVLTPDAPRQLLDGYRGAAHVVLTNADTRAAAQALGLEHVSCIPHPVDTDRFSPVARATRATDGPLVCFSPTRHDEAEKATSVTVEAFAAAGLPDARLVLVDHGADAPAIRRRCTALGLDGRVTWLPLLPKWRLAAAYRAADVVFDQFAPQVGAFGTIAVEALACGRPLITHLDLAAHDWCADVLPAPPVCLAADAAEAARFLRDLAGDAAYRDRRGDQGRAWVERWQTPERVAGLWAGVCQQALRAPTADTPALVPVAAEARPPIFNGKDHG